MYVYIHLVSTCWILFLFVWVFVAGMAKPAALRQTLRKDIAYKVLFVLGAVFLFWQPFLGSLQNAVLPQNAAFAGIGLLLCVFGLAGAFWSRSALGRNWSSVPMIKERHELVTKGPYRYARHPIYTSLLLMILGTALAFGTGDALLGLLFFLVGIIVKIRQEETLLSKEFPNDYPAYKAKVKTLIPFVW